MNATYVDPRQMELSEALQEIERREALFVAKMEDYLRELQKEGVELAGTVDAATVYTLERAGFYFDFQTGRVGRSL